jgi:spore germination protein AB
MKSISTRQIIIFYGIYSFAIKFLSLPATLSKTAGKDAWIAALIGTVIELLILLPILFWISKKPEKSIYDSLLKKPQIPLAIIAKLFMLLFFCVFFYETLILTNQTYHLINENLFDRVPYYFFSLPLIFMGAFFCFNPTRSIFRSGEIFFVFIIIGVVISVFPTFSNIDLKELLPIGKSGIKNIFMAVLKSAIYFESIFFLLIFKGEIKIEKHFIKKFMTTAIIIGLFFVFFVFMFTAVFGATAPLKSIAITTYGGRLDWMLITIWLLLLVLRFGITFFAGFKCLKFIASPITKKVVKYNGLLTLALCIVLGAAIYFVYTFVGVIPYV